MVLWCMYLLFCILLLHLLKLLNSCGLIYHKSFFFIIEDFDFDNDATKFMGNDEVCKKKKKIEIGLETKNLSGKKNGLV